MENTEDINHDLYREIVVEDENSTVLMEQPFNPSSINIDLKSPTISILIDRLQQTPPEIDMFTDFQRKDDLWDEGKQSRLIESILIKLPLPAFYFDGTDDNKWLVVDGLQRLSALRNFIIRKTLKLTGLEFLKNLEGQFYDALPRSAKRTIDTTQITAHIINPGTPPLVKFNIFKRINTGGLVLEPQEIRHALNQGIPAMFVAELASCAEFKKATENKIDTSRMLDREFATRFMAFYLTSPGDYAPDLDSFLNHAMDRAATLSILERDQIRSAFARSMETAFQLFGNWAFRKADQYPDRRKPISKPIFDVWAVTLARQTDAALKKLIGQKKKVMSLFAKLCQDDAKFIDSISSGTGEKHRVACRFEKIEKLVQEALND